MSESSRSDAGASAGGAPEEAERRTRAAGRVLLALAAVGVAVAYVAAGLGGLLVALTVVAVLGLALLLLTLPGAPPPPVRPRRAVPVADAPYVSYRQVAEAMSWARVSPRHYDLVTRPMLQRLLANRLAEHHRVDLYADPAAARRLVGDDTWRWLDPQRPAERSSQPPGVDLRTLTRIVERLETL